jgi:hypothetical protein
MKMSQVVSKVVVWSLAGAIGLAVASPSVVRADCPSLPAIQRAAERAGGLSSPTDPRRRARLAALLPTVSVRGGQRLAWSEPWNGRIVDELDRAQSIEVRLTWRLERLAFRDDEPRIASEHLAQRRARTTLRQEVAAAYFRWRRAELQRGAGDDAELDADAAFAEVDALTLGWLREACE